MNSNNITMHKFGIENNYISMAMNTMLGKTNNTVKSMNISETNVMVIDSNWNCIESLIGFVVGWVLLILGALTVEFGVGAFVWLAGLFFLSSYGVYRTATACGW